MDFGNDCKISAYGFWCAVERGSGCLKRNNRNAVGWASMSRATPTGVDRLFQAA
ncbi:MAG: hypothetical protein J6M43_02130 [Neisseriaceae bacterium]|nr:hypothetical protein [Neisseriaceae bacterium]